MVTARTPTRWVARLAFAAVAALGAGCEDEVLDMLRPDIGVRDTGAMAPLALDVGMSFSYRSTLTYRGAGANDEGSAVYQLGYTIQGVDDAGPGQSAITVTASGQNMLDMDWIDPRDFDPWVARLGPARSTDSVNPAPFEVPLDGAPALPARSNAAKSLPAPATFFIDVRDMDALRAAWTATHADRSPRVVDPANNNGRWLFRYEGREPGLGFYDGDDAQRTIRLEYDPRGFLVSISEELGAPDPMARPRCTANLNLTDGPD